jgi:Ca2+-binding EF-hand superfamily protein
MSRITKTVSDAQISNIRQKFQEADDNNNGFLTVEELKHFLGLVGWNDPTDADAETVMTKLAKGKSNVNFFTLMQTYDIWSAGIVHSTWCQEFFRLFVRLPTVLS